MSASMLNTHVRDNFNALVQSTATITTTGTQTALTIPPGRGDLVIFANNASLLTLQGIAAGENGQKLTIAAIGAGQVDLAHQNGNAAAAARLINFATSGNTPLAAGSGLAILVYDAIAARWRLVHHEQGAWITPAFSASNFAGNGSLTWTVDATDVVTNAYRLAGRMLTVTLDLSPTSTGGTANTQLIVGNGAWGGFTAAKLMVTAGRYSDAGATTDIGSMHVSASGTQIIFQKRDTGTWSNAASNNGTNEGIITFEVQ